jgi:hypothetical protein
MSDPIERLRKLIQEGQNITNLRQRAEKSEGDRWEKDWRKFLDNIVSPAFKCAQDEFGEKWEPLTERQECGEPGFKVKYDDLESEFWLWIEFQGRVPVARAGRKSRKPSWLTKIPVQEPLASSNSVDVNDVTQEAVLVSICSAYEKYRQL